MAAWLSDKRVSFAAVIIILLLVGFISSIVIGRKQTALTDKDEVFGDLERIKGGGTGSSVVSLH